MWSIYNQNRPVKLYSFKNSHFHTVLILPFAFNILRNASANQQKLYTKYSPPKINYHSIKPSTSNKYYICTFNCVWGVACVAALEGFGIGARIHKPATQANEGWRMVFQKIWFSQNFSRISRVSQYRFLSRF